MTKIKMSDRMEMVPLKDIRPYKRNPRNNTEAVPKVAESILKFGFRNPIILDKENVVIAGHTRLLAAKKLGLKEVPCIWANDLTPDEVKALRLVDNKTAEYAEWELDLLSEELNDINLDLSAFDFDIFTGSLENLDEDDNSLIQILRTEKDCFLVSLVFKKEDEELVKNFIKENKKEGLVDEILKLMKRKEEGHAKMRLTDVVV